MAAEYGFDNDQRSKLDELLSDENIGVWTEVLSGITESDGEIVRIALSQLGNVGGEPYWSWYGFGSRVEWCACFVSWCANECGYIDRGIVPKFAGCENGMAWFRERGRWLDGNNEPTPGMLVFFDWTDESGVQDGNADHVGIVQKVMGDKIYTVEGNSGDTVRVNEYDVGHFEIIGFGTYSP